MTFQFSFPTLKNLSMIRIGQAVLDKETSCSIITLHFLRSVDSRFDDGTEIIIIEDLVSSLVEIRGLRHDLADVIHGMYEQIRTINSSMYWDNDYMTPIFDVHGRIDVAAIWKCYFEDQLNTVESVETAMELLDDALVNQVWGDIGTIIAKIMSLVGLDSDSLPKPKLIRNDDGEYVLAYCVGDLLSEPSCASEIVGIFDNYNLSNGDCFHVTISSLCLLSRFVCLREFFITMEESEKKSFIEQVIPCLRHRYDPAIFAVEIISFLDDVMLSHLMVKLSEGRDNFAPRILCNMLHWPFTQFFIPLLELLARFLKTKDYAKLFVGIVSRIQSQRGFGFLYREVMLRFCQAIPLNVKQELFEGSEKAQRFTETLESLRHDNPKLHERLVKILSSQAE